MNIYGHDIELEESNPGEIITDVIIPVIPGFLG